MRGNFMLFEKIQEAKAYKANYIKILAETCFANFSLAKAFRLPKTR